METQSMNVWICSDCCEFELDRYSHTCEWSEDFVILPFSEYHNTDAEMDEADEGYDGFGKCINCRDAVSELGSGWFIENAEVSVEFYDEQVHYSCTVQT